MIKEKPPPLSKLHLDDEGEVEIKEKEGTTKSEKLKRPSLTGKENTHQG